MASIVVVFDFDRTLLDVDSDDWVVTQMGLKALFRQLMRSMPWTDLMNRMMEELHAIGKTVDDIAECLTKAPIHSSTLTAIKSAYALGCDLKVLSDANQFFIETILKHNGIFRCFSEIITNPASVDQQGRLTISPYCDFTSSPHGCNLCPHNLCKGLVMNRLRSSEIGPKRRKYIYLGDGKGDYCPAISLKDGDFLMPRKGYYLWEHIGSNPTVTEAQVHGWTNGEELEEILLCLINKTVCNSNGCKLGHTSSSDCKCEAGSCPAHESSPQTVSVPR
uniref:Uncharacterized protein n=1 Tax=Kalanchoe fedtschenkoi TaxID=63787 RepID=A0A7N0UVZ8_KALFE